MIRNIAHGRDQTDNHKWPTRCNTIRSVYLPVQRNVLEATGRNICGIFCCFRAENSQQKDVFQKSNVVILCLLSAQYWELCQLFYQKIILSQHIPC
jgi:hypothetical protein